MRHVTTTARQMVGTLYAVVLAVAACLSPAVADAQTDRTRAAAHSFDIPAGDLAAALDRFSTQSGIQLLYRPQLVAGKRAQAVRGTLSSADALKRLLEGTGVIWERANDATYALKPAPQPPPPEPEPAKSVTPQAMQSVTELEKIVVTGSNIRGAQNTTSPILIFDREDIERTGYSTTQQLFQSLPQNVNNISDTTFRSINGGVSAFTGDAAGVNLRGLGGNSTLVLINGRRVASAANGSFVDMSLIPLTAVQRVEVLTDGASAIYGSDAVAGVVNVILREQFAGAETSLRYGGVTSGDSTEYQASQTFGHFWDTGSVLLSYELYRRTDLENTKRHYTQDAPFSFDLVPDQARQNLLLTATQDLSERVSLWGDLLYGRRESTLDYDFGIPTESVSEFTQLGTSLGAKIDLGDDWLLSVGGVYGRNHALGDDRSADLPNRYDYLTQVHAFDAMADGPLVSLPGGDMRLAVGGQFRHEQLEPRAFGGALVQVNRLQRDISAVYAELHVPLVGKSNRRAGIERLELSLAGRYERYSDFGDTFNPKLGVSWKPTATLNLRSSYGTSFRAPLLSELNPVNVQPVAYLMEDTSGSTTALVLSGSGVDLQPEEAETWTAGFDWTPTAWPGFSAKFTWFDISYEHRIMAPLPSDARFFDLLVDPTYAPFVDRTPDPSLVAELVANPRFIDAAGISSPDDILAMADNRLINISSTTLRGVDLTLAYQLQAAGGDLSFEVGGNRLLDGARTILPGTPRENTLDSVYLQSDLRLRGSAAWQRGPFTAAAYVNYTDGYPDRRAPGVAGPDQRASVASWTTVDLSLRFRFGETAVGWRRGLEFGLTAQNVFDRDPPFVASAFGIEFDGVNANPLGRFLSLQARKRW